MRALLPPSPGEVDLDGLERAYAVPAGRPHVRLNFVASVDGAVEVGGRSGPLGGPADKRVFALLRGLADVVLVGAGTARAEDYGPVRVSQERQERRRAAGLAPVPRLAVVTARAGLDPRARLFAVRPLVLTAAASDEGRRRALSEVADVVVCGEERVDVAAALDALADRGLARVLCEGGPALAADVAAGNRLDELCLTLAPILAGPGRATLTSGEPWPAPLGLGLAGVLEEEGTLFLRYARTG